MLVIKRSIKPFISEKPKRPVSQGASASLAGIMGDAIKAVRSTAVVAEKAGLIAHAQAKKPRAKPEMPLEERVIAFIETLKVPDGPDVGRLIELRDWQKRMIRQVYGPRRLNDKKQDVRAIRQAVWTLARKNGKTSLAGGLILNHLTGPCAVWNGQLFSVAFEVSQAALSFKVVQSMVLQDAELSGRVMMTESTKRAICHSSNSMFKALSSESRSKHGLNPNFVLFDEFAQFNADRTLFDVMMTSMGAQLEPLSLIISTQAPSDNAILSELIDHGRSVNQGNVIDPTFHLTEYSTPKDVDPFDESKWHLANPALGDFRSLDEMRQYANRARTLPTMMNSFRNLYLNQRVASVATFVDEINWARCEQKFNLDDLEGKSCTGGLDLSSKVDLTSLVLVFDDPKYIIPFFWTPENTLAERTRRDRVPYEKWVDLGYMEAVPGSSIDFRFIAMRIAQLSAIYNIRMIGFDRWRVDVLQTWFDEYGVSVPMVPIGQGYRDGTLMVEGIETDILNANIIHDGHPVLKWNALNTRAIKDPAGNRKFDKSTVNGRIDGFVALAMANRVKDLAIDNTLTQPILIL